MILAAIPFVPLRQHAAAERTQQTLGALARPGVRSWGSWAVTSKQLVGDDSPLDAQQVPEVWTVRFLKSEETSRGVLSTTRRATVNVAWMVGPRHRDARKYPQLHNPILPPSRYPSFLYSPHHRLTSPCFIQRPRAASFPAKQIKIKNSSC